MTTQRPLLYRSSSARIQSPGVEHARRVNHLDWDMVLVNSDDVFELVEQVLLKPMCLFEDSRLTRILYLARVDNSDARTMKVSRSLIASELLRLDMLIRSVQPRPPPHSPDMALSPSPSFECSSSSLPPSNGGIVGVAVGVNVTVGFSIAPPTWADAGASTDNSEYAKIMLASAIVVVASQRICFPFR